MRPTLTVQHLRITYPNRVTDPLIFLENLNKTFYPIYPFLTERLVALYYSVISPYKDYVLDTVPFPAIVKNDSIFYLTNLADFQLFLEQTCSKHCELWVRTIGNSFFQASQFLWNCYSKHDNGDGTFELRRKV